MTTSAIVACLFVAATTALAACNRSKPQVAVGPSDAVETSAPAAHNPGDLNQRIVSALQEGRYADAVVFARQARVSKAERDFAVGEIILQGHADPRPAQTPRESIEAGLELLEVAAMAGHQQAISGLAATFRTGLQLGAGGTFVLRPEIAISHCWDSAKGAPGKARSCIEMRKRGN